MKINILFLLLLIPSISFAQIKVTEPSVPESLHIYDTAGNTYVDHLLGDCTSRRYHLSPNHIKYDAIFSVLLAAQTAQKQVRIRYDGCTNSGSQGNIIGVYLVD